MARYIDADALIRLIEIDALCNGGNFSKRDVIACVKASPTADVVPKSEYEALKEMLDATIAGQESLQKSLAQAKSEVEQMLAEIEKTIRGALILVDFSYKHNIKETQCKKEYYEDFLGYIAELKKKYIEGGG